jgi:ABC-type transporter Mla maintaining outer membrane lipid asymmetry ATPase subunit MlaF
MIELHDLALAAPDGRLLLKELALAVPRGGRQLITGASGSGKSRLLQVIAGTEQPLRGQVAVGGRRLWPGDGALAGAVEVGLAFARGGLLSNLSLGENLALPLRFRGLPAAEVAARVGAALDRLGLSSVAGLRPHALSASARKHGNLARVLALAPELILLDDPLEGLDSADRATALEVIRAWELDPGKTLVIAQEEPDPFAGAPWRRFAMPSPPLLLEVP